MAHTLPFDARRFIRLVAVLALFASLVVVANTSTAPPAEATHFRANQITWQATSNANEIDFHATGSWRMSAFFTTPPSVGDTFFPASVEHGDGTSNFSSWTVTSVDSVNDVVSGELHGTHAYSGPGPWTLSISSCCRLSPPLHRNNGDGSVRIESIVDLSVTTASPVSSISPIVDCPTNALCTFFVPAFDPDSQALSWRMSTDVEASGFVGGFTQPAGATIAAGTGLYSWDTTGASLNPSGDSFFSTQVMVENPGGVKTPVDFFIRLGSSSTNQAPVFTAPTPTDGTVINGTVGSPITFDVAASDPDTGDTVTLGMLGRPAAATYTTSPGNPATGTFSWTPTATGTVILTLTAQDQLGLGATQRSVTINVGGQTPTDTDPPMCELVSVDPGPPTTLRVHVQDAGSGLDSIVVSKAVNATVVVPSFTSGSTDLLEVTATKVNESKRARVELTVTDVAGNVTVCDPVITLEVREAGKPATSTFTDIPAAEDTVTVYNGDPGVSTLDVTVNGTTFRVRGLRSGEERTLDIGSALQPGDANVVELTVNGKPGSSATVMIWDGNN